MQQQQPQQGRRFADTAPMQPVRLFPQNEQPGQGWQPQTSYSYPQQQTQPMPVIHQPVQQAAYPQPAVMQPPLAAPTVNVASQAVAAEPAKPLKKQRKRKQRKEKSSVTIIRFSLVWNLLAVIGLITVILTLARYVVIPLLVYLYGLTGGAL